jgi:hypothetical protein
MRLLSLQQMLVGIVWQITRLLLLLLLLLQMKGVVLQTIRLMLQMLTWAALQPGRQ